MFHSARLKLTGWYLLIIMTISLAFSVVIYKGLARELEKGFRRAELRLKAKELGIFLPRRFSDRLEDLPPRLKEISPRFLFVEDLKTAKERLILNLLIINGTILGISAVAGYFLAGKTLKPIENAMEKQKRFVADASHELCSPLTALKTSMEVALRDKKMSLSEARKVIRSNLKDVDGLQSLTDNLLSLASFQSNSQNLIFEEISVAQGFKKAYRKILPLAKKKNISIKLKIKSQKICVNRESFEQMALIFLDNAVKYTPQGGKVTVIIQKNKKHLVIKIADTGIGITEEELPYIFDRFYRASQSRSKRYLRSNRSDVSSGKGSHESSDGIREEVTGFGLGLSLAKKIIEVHKGSIKVESQLGKGTIFTIKLPLKHF